MNIKIKESIINSFYYENFISRSEAYSREIKRSLKNENYNISSKIIERYEDALHDYRRFLKLHKIPSLNRRNVNDIY